EREGYTLEGWYMDSAYKLQYNFLSLVKGDFTLYAKWKINSYTVSYESNDGSAVVSETVDYKLTATTPVPPLRNGHTFDGWYTDSEFKTQYNFSSLVTADVQLYAKWVINSYVV